MQILFKFFVSRFNFVSKNQGGGGNKVIQQFDILIENINKRFKTYLNIFCNVYFPIIGRFKPFFGILFFLFFFKFWITDRYHIYFTNTNISVELADIL